MLSSVFLFVFGCTAAGAHTGDFRGVVLAIQASRGAAVIRREPAEGIPGSTAVYHLHASDLTRLHVDDRIAAQLKNAKAPSLEDVHILPAAASRTLTQTIRNVHILQEGQPVPDTRLTDQNGKAFTFSSLRGHDVVFAFIYTRCRDARMCPLISAKFAQLQNAFHAGGTKLVEVTLDPEYDTPAVLAKYAALFGAHWTLATGRANDVLNFDAQFGIQPFSDPKFGIIHTERTVIADKQGVIRYIIDDPAWEPAGIIAQVNAVDGTTGNLWARFDLALSRAAVAVCGDRVAGFSGLLDLLVFAAILAAFAWGFYRIARAMASAKP